MKTYRDAPAQMTSEEAQAWEAGYVAGVADAVAQILARTYPSSVDRDQTGGYRKTYADAVRALIEEDV